MIHKDFQNVVNQIGEIGKQWHLKTILENVEKNSSRVKKTLRDLPAIEAVKKRSAIVISAGPSLNRHRCIEQIRESNYKGTLICVDGSYISCLRRNVIPDYVVTLDPHPTRIIRWFGDKDIKRNEKGDDYFLRQDLDTNFRDNQTEKNEENIQLVNEMADKSKLVICTTAPENVERRTREAKFDRYWWNPLVDDPKDSSSLTRKFYSAVQAPCMNTGGTVGTAAWVFAENILKIESIALIGTDLGYFIDTPKEMTQTIYELEEHTLKEKTKDKKDLKYMFPKFTFPLNGNISYTDPTYYWYRKNFLELLSRANNSKTYNCTETGTLFGKGVSCVPFKDFLLQQS